MRVPGTSFEYGRPQFFATLLLLAFLAQTTMLAVTLPRTEDEEFTITAGAKRLQDTYLGPCCTPEAPRSARPSGKTFDIAPLNGRVSQPLTEFLAAAPVVWRRRFGMEGDAPWLPRVPGILLGLFLGASVWWVSRRLYGDSGGYIALALYVFMAPSVWAIVNAEMPLAMAWFGIVFITIGLAHNLYAPPRHWILRALMLVAALVAGYHLNSAATAALVPALLFLIYLAPGRRVAALGMFTLSVLASYGAGALLSPLSEFIPLVAPTPMLHASAESIGLGPGLTAQLLYLVALSLAALVVWVWWPRTRYFGNSAPLLVMLIAFGFHWTTWLAFGPVIVVFAMVFIAGICADLLETCYRRPVLIGIVVLLVVHAAAGLYTVARLVTLNS